MWGNCKCGSCKKKIQCGSKTTSICECDIDDVRINGISIVDGKKIANIKTGENMFFNEQDGTLNAVGGGSSSPTEIINTDGNLTVTGSGTYVVYVDLSNAFKQKVDDKQDKLISGTNIKTINGESVLGNGDLVIKHITTNIYLAQLTIDDDGSDWLCSDFDTSFSNVIATRILNIVNFSGNATFNMTSKPISVYKKDSSLRGFDADYKILYIPTGFRPFDGRNFNSKIDARWKGGTKSQIQSDITNNYSSDYGISQESIFRKSSSTIFSVDFSVPFLGFQTYVTGTTYPFEDTAIFVERVLGADLRFHETFLTDDSASGLTPSGTITL